MQSVKICGVPFEIKEVSVIDEGAEGITQGKIVYSEGKIYIKNSLPLELKKSVLFHEILHGMLVMLGYGETSDNETFVQSLSVAMYNIFDIKEGNDSIHQSKHNKGKKITEQQKQSIRISNHKRKGKRAKYKSEVTPETVFALKSQGLSFNKISKILNLDWGCVKQRYEDYVHDNPELLK